MRNLQGKASLLLYLLDGSAETYARFAAGERPEPFVSEGYMDDGPDLGTED